MEARVQHKRPDRSVKTEHTPVSVPVCESCGFAVAGHADYLKIDGLYYHNECIPEDLKRVIELFGLTDKEDEP